jgi:hypothetical protein
MTRYSVVTRQGLPVDRFFALRAAAGDIVREQRWDRWTLLAQEGNKITASTPYRELTRTERVALERQLYPSLFQ